MNIENPTSPVDVYLHTVGAHLRPLPRAERVSVLEEIDSKIEELRFFGGCSIESAIHSMGDPRTLAKRYLASFLEKNEGFNLRVLLIRLSLCDTDDVPSVAALSALSFLSFGTILFGIVAIVYGFIETGRFIMGYGSSSATFPLGLFGVHPLMALLVYFLSGLALIAAGMICWRVLKLNPRMDSNRRRER